MHVSTDNFASTALRSFVTGIREYGFPSRVRADGGSEFNHVCTLMESVNGYNRGSLIRGPSVHNTRIERLWRDVYCKCLDKYYKLFGHMVFHGVLNLGNCVHMFSLHFVFAPRIQHTLQVWV